MEHYEFGNITLKSACDHGSPKKKKREGFHSNSDFHSLHVITLWRASRLWPTYGGEFGRGTEVVICAHLIRY